MKDKYGREITYLRVSVTEKCNLRCKYCMPEVQDDRICFDTDMSADEIIEIVNAIVRLGIKKIRITGGEPLIRKDILELCYRISHIGGVEELGITTNAVYLSNLARELKQAGVNRINISLDTLDPEKYYYITGGGEIEKVFDGIEAAALHGLKPIKINAVLIGGFNDNEIKDFVMLTKNHPIEMRFIELMPIGNAVGFDENAYIPVSSLLQKLPQLKLIGYSGTAKLYKIPGYKGKIGFISPLSSHFCGDCNKIRLTADGNIKPCLHSSEEISIRGLHGDVLIQRLRESIEKKPKQHFDLSKSMPSQSKRSMNRIGG